MTQTVPIADGDRLFIRIVAIGFLAGIALSFSFWVGTRGFPPLPVIPALSAPPFIRQGLGLLLLVCLLGVVLRPSRAAVSGVLAALGTLALLDVTALQPWAYQYALMLGAVGFSRVGQGRTLVLLVLGLTYIWSALHKLNPGFFDTIVPLFHPLGDAAPPLAPGLAMIAVELAVGVGLLWRSTAQAAAVLAVLMHAVILLMRGLDGSNLVVLPWNVVVALLAVLSAWTVEFISWREVLRGRAGRVVLTLCGALPLLGTFGFWDPYPSFMLYSGNVDRATVAIHPADVERLGISAFTRLDDGDTVLDASDWPLREMGLPGYPAAWAHRRLAAVLCEDLEHPGRMRLVVHHRLTLVRRVPRESLHRCVAL